MQAAYDEEKRGTGKNEKEIGKEKLIIIKWKIMRQPLYVWLGHQRNLFI